ncbi:MAG: Signal peptidase-like protein [Cytophagales bacterium]|nr:Signal peptidase-like protein [Cytophagales bacterium]
MNVYDWLSNMSIPEDQKYNIVELRFKGGRKGYYRNENGLDLVKGDWVVIESKPNYHIGEVSLQGELVRLQLRKRKITKLEELPVIMRVASEKDIAKRTQSIEREMPILYKSREIIKNTELKMKLSDVEVQADNLKATFYYSADDRVDFRELIKRLAGEFKVRVEMKQISLRQEAARLGGIGSCGRELCCSTWLSDFKNVSTSGARYQNLSLNPQKLAGQCSRLKCCINFELETYLAELKDIPEVKGVLKTEMGVARLQKTDIFKKLMWFSYDDSKEIGNTWVQVSAQRVKEIIALNENGELPFSLEKDAIDVEEANAPINNDLLQLDKRLNKKGNRNNKNKGGNKRNPKKANSNTPSNRKQQQGQGNQQQSGGQQTKKSGGTRNNNPSNRNRNNNSPNRRKQGENNNNNKRGGSNNPNNKQEKGNNANSRRFNAKRKSAPTANKAEGNNSNPTRQNNQKKRTNVKK